jgi:hypothetical protein
MDETYLAHDWDGSFREWKGRVLLDGNSVRGGWLQLEKERFWKVCDGWAADWCRAADWFELWTCHNEQCRYAEQCRLLATCQKNQTCLSPRSNLNLVNGWLVSHSVGQLYHHQLYRMPSIKLTELIQMCLSFWAYKLDSWMMLTTLVNEWMIWPLFFIHICRAIFILLPQCNVDY